MADIRAHEAEISSMVWQLVVGKQEIADPVLLMCCRTR